MKQKIKINKLYKNETDKNGKRYEYQGKPITKVTVVSDSGDKFYCNLGKWNSSWKEGDEVEAEVVEKEYNGTIYRNLKGPQGSFGGGCKLDDFASTFESMNQKLDKIINLLSKTNVHDDGDVPF